MPSVIPIQESLRPTRPVVHGCRDDNEEKRLLERTDRILILSGAEQLFLSLSLSLSLSVERFDAKAAGTRTEDHFHPMERHIHKSRQGSPLHRSQAPHPPVFPPPERGSGPDPAPPLVLRMCGLVRVPGKSTLQDYAKWWKGYR